MHGVFLKHNLSYGLTCHFINSIKYTSARKMKDAFRNVRIFSCDPNLLTFLLKV